MHLFTWKVHSLEFFEQPIYSKKCIIFTTNIETYRTLFLKCRNTCRWHFACLVNSFGIRFPSLFSSIQCLIFGNQTARRKLGKSIELEDFLCIVKTCSKWREMEMCAVNNTKYLKVINSKKCVFISARVVYGYCGRIKKITNLYMSIQLWWN